MGTCGRVSVELLYWGGEESPVHVHPSTRYMAVSRACLWGQVKGLVIVEEQYCIEVCGSYTVYVGIL